MTLPLEQARIGIIGLGSDLILGWVGRRLFPWRKDAVSLFRRRKSATPEVAEVVA